ncbi:MAG: DUF507 family protein [bacterium]|jgi:hypothetical protein|nr:DUF507 family protein [bacterium]MBK7045709.1 DUF507 family protein [bacterium]MBK7188099.1 DUF507 family protein [bacterium]MBK7671341.1 DUF507 family protein [bacterium]MBK7769859.1 DUF507 family protein [bacterium]
MRLSEERITVLAKEICERLLDEELVDIELAENDFMRLVEMLIMTDLRIEDEIDEQTTTFLLKNRPQLEEGSTAWEVEFERKKLDLSMARGYVAF